MTARDHSDLDVRPDSNTTEPACFEPPSAEEISLCCEISAYAPDGDDRPLF